MMKSPFNWSGNKYKFLTKIEKYLNPNKKTFVLDLFCGSGNIGLNTESEFLILNDLIPLIPKIYHFMTKNSVSLIKIHNIIKKYNFFEEKKEYYLFRKDWNTLWKFGKVIINEEFIIRSLLLTKMCSNSMIRFNSKKEFNQGFRGTSGPFFNETRIASLVDSTHKLNQCLIKKNIICSYKSFEKIHIPNECFLIADPPYLIRQGMYSKEFSKRNLNYLLKVLSDKINSIDFIYFDYLSFKSKKEEIINYSIKKFIEENNGRLKVILLRNKSTSGQKRIGKSITEEVMITNIIGN